MAREFILPVTTEEYKQAGSKFISMSPDAKEGDNLLLDVECGMLDWETAGKSLKLPVTVVEEGLNYGKTDKAVFGVVQYGDKTGVWKGKEIYRNVTGKDPESKMASDDKMHPVFTVEDFLGKLATGHWQLTKGKKGGDPLGEDVFYPKLVSILPSRGAPVMRVSTPSRTATPVGMRTPVDVSEAESIVLQAVIGSTEEDIAARVAKVPQIQALGLSTAGLFRAVDQLAEKGLIAKDDSERYQKV